MNTKDNEIWREVRRNPVNGRSWMMSSAVSDFCYVNWSEISVYQKPERLDPQMILGWIKECDALKMPAGRIEVVEGMAVGVYLNHSMFRQTAHSHGMFDDDLRYFRFERDVRLSLDVPPVDCLYLEFEEPIELPRKLQVRKLVLDFIRFRPTNIRQSHRKLKGFRSLRGLGGAAA